MSSFAYLNGLKRYSENTYALGTTSTDIMLLKNTYVPLNSHEFVSDISSHEVSGSGYARKSWGVISGTKDHGNNRVDISGPGNAAWTGVSGFTARYIAVYYNSGSDSTSPLLFLIDLVSDRTPTTSLSASWTSNIFTRITQLGSLDGSNTYQYTYGGKLGCLNGTVIWKTSGGTTLKAVLLKTSYNPIANEIDKESCSSWTASEASGTGYVSGYGNSGRKTIAGKSAVVNSSTGRLELRCSPIEWTSLTNIGDIGYIGIMKETGGNDTSSIPIVLIRLSQPCLLASAAGDFYYNPHDAGCIHYY